MTGWPLRKRGKPGYAARRLRRRDQTATLLAAVVGQFDFDR
jgi:hypothetical protein